MDGRIERRGFLRKAGLTVGLAAAAPVVGGALAAPAQAAVPCPYQDDYWTPEGTPDDQLADLLEHLGREHHQDQETLFRELASRMRGALP